jgi:hypothetical protein
MNLFKSLPYIDDLTTGNLSQTGVIVLTDSNLSEDPDHAEWDSGTAYVTGNIVRVTSTHKLYEAIVNNTNKFPPDNLGVEWIEIGATNLWRAFDQKVGSQTVAETSGGITFEFQVNSLTTAVALFNLIATDVKITVTPPGISPVEFEVSLIDTSEIIDWFTYFFTDTTSRQNVLISGLPGYAGSTMVIEITGAPATAVGEIAAGRLQQIGDTAWGGRIEALDFSRVDEDVFGNVTILRRGSAKRVEFPVMWPSNDTGRVDRILDSIRSEPAVFAATTCDDPYGFFVYGFYQTYDINVAGPALAYATIEVRTLT